MFDELHKDNAFIVREESINWRDAKEFHVVLTCRAWIVDAAASARAWMTSQVRGTGAPGAVPGSRTSSRLMQAMCKGGALWCRGLGFHDVDSALSALVLGLWPFRLLLRGGDGQLWDEGLDHAKPEGPCLVG